MALYRTPEEHAANPPSTWVVTKVGRRWALQDARGATLQTYDTKAGATLATKEGFWPRLYAQEGDWFAGRPVPGWKPYRQESVGARFLRDQDLRASVAPRPPVGWPKPQIVP